MLHGRSTADVSPASRRCRRPLPLNESSFAVWKEAYETSREAGWTLIGRDTAVGARPPGDRATRQAGASCNCHSLTIAQRIMTYVQPRAASTALPDCSCTVVGSLHSQLGIRMFSIDRPILRTLNIHKLSNDVTMTSYTEKLFWSLQLTRLVGQGRLAFFRLHL